MTQSKRTTTSHYQQLQSAERTLIMNWRFDGRSCHQIAQMLHRSPSTISREIRRGSVHQLGPNRRPTLVYWAESAQLLHNKAREACHAQSWLDKAPQFFLQLTKALKKRQRLLSVDTFVHYYQVNHPDDRCPSVPTVYRYIDAGVLKLKNGDLPMKLRRHARSGYRSHKRLNKRNFGKSIEELPVEAQERQVAGHWEGDLVKGKREASEPALMTLIDRAKRYAIIVKIPNYHADTCLNTLQNIVDDYGPEHFKTVLFDNGSEFSKLSQVKGPDVYFAHPYSPWERGSNEHLNGEIREFIPKGKSMKELSIVNVQAIQDILNSRPRKVLGYQTAMSLLPDFD
ncbi:MULTISPECIES: IS30 family transposase [Lactobacillaceae]|jgi:IS30 family transposase|uniref:IS30 family transposase n=1 Tax=Lactobacillaceae TaxID=33958 RepID=UPI001F425F5F|nr:MULTISPECIES: IS30 family transposase [Levilactobacillus]MCE6011839.1 IS30 family transposase [Levilactobacillus brevis]MCE6037221.1 IS30 family transposase [Levilactobacillus brevis]MDT6980837.1 IS30 family transposase [Levilactobacillus zymae]MDT6981680.1 IS30 family transposase [Levilactobacillus zymae]MDT6981689.1 IS30 family transposase [Levilactobacillus zymae]